MTRARDRIRNGYWGLLLLCVLVASARQVRAGEEGGGEGAEQADVDFIKRNDSQTVHSTKVTRDDYLMVEGAFKSVPVKVQAWAVKEVLYADRDSNYSTALEKRDLGQYKNAARYFREAQKQLQGKKWSQEYCSFGIADALFEAGLFTGWTDKLGNVYQPASAYYRDVLKANAKSRFILDCVVKIAVCLVEEGKLDEADAAFKEAEGAIKKYRDEVIKQENGTNYLKLADRANALTLMGNGRLLERKADQVKQDADYQPALNAYKRAQTASAGKYVEIYTEAVDGELRTLVSSKDFPGARDRADSLITRYKESSDPTLVPVLPGAYLVMGQANFSEAATAEGKAQTVQANKLYADARWCFLQVVVQFFDKDEYVAKAHYLAGLCNEKRKGIEKDAAAKAIRHWRMIERDYAKSVFYEPAMKGIERLGGAPKADAPKADAPKEGAAPQEAPKDAAPKDAPKPKDAPTPKDAPKAEVKK